MFINIIIETYTQSVVPGLLKSGMRIGLLKINTDLWVRGVLNSTPVKVIASADDELSVRVG